MEKLSELSKPVAWKFKNADGGDRVSLERKANIYGRHNFQPCYSQEYVSALIQRAERLDSMLTESVQALKAAEQRVAELELRLAVEIEPPPVIYPGSYDCHAMHSAIRRAGFRVSGDSEHVGDVDMRDERALAAVSDKQRIAELEARLATPVRLPRPACTYADHSYPAYSRKQVEEIITSAGMRFTVEGDE